LIGPKDSLQHPNGGFQVKATTQIFLSYAREDEEKVEKLYQRLSEAGFKPWMDKKDIRPGEKWKTAIQKAIRDSDFFLACLSANSVSKRGILQGEVKEALDIWQEKLKSDIYLIPVRLEDCEVPENLRDFQWVDLFEEDGWTRLKEAIEAVDGRKDVSRRWRWVALLLGALYPLTIFISILMGRWIETHKQIYRTYEWQWAGENWCGRLTCNERNGQNVITEAKVGLIEKDCATDQIWMDGKVLEMVDESTFDITDSGIEINLTVKKINKRTGEPVRETIKGPLQQTLCYAGKVIYSSTAGDFEGDMILVGELSSSLGPKVEDWIRSENNPWANYDGCVPDQTPGP
jgi:hypothetical protein